MMTLSEQYDEQKAYAEGLVAFRGWDGKQRTRGVALVAVTYLADDIQPRISIVGGAVSPAAIEAWRRMGASCNVVEIVGDSPFTYAGADR